MTNLQDPIFIKKLNTHLRNGGVIAFPTDTVWGLGALPTPMGANAIFEIKQRPTNKHLIIMSNKLQNLTPYMKHFPRHALDLAKKYWPGALTIGTPVSGNDTSVFGGVRVPNYKPFHDLCEIIDGHCLATSSANISGMPPLKNADDIRKQFPNIIVIDNQYQQMGNTPSTVVILDANKTIIARQGGVILGATDIDCHE